MAPAVTISKSGSATAPSLEDITAVTNTIFTTSQSQESLDASYALTNLLLESVGFRGLQEYGILDEIKKAAGDKKNPGRREGAMFALGALFERFPVQQPLSEVVFLLQEDYVVPLALDALADKNSSVRESAQYALDAFFNNLKPEALAIGLLPAVVKYLGKKTGKWQGTVGGYATIGRMADKAKMGMGSREEEQVKDILREAMGKRLEGLIPVVEAGMHDLKSEVSKQAIKTMNSLTTLLQNDDVAPRITLLIKSMENPSTESLQKAIHALSQTTFVSIVTSPVLALLTPLLERSLNTPTTSQEVLRQTVVVVENLTKLVHDPVEARVFLPRLKPGVKSVKDRASLPEVREIGTRALEVIDKAMGGGDDDLAQGAVARTKAADVLAVLEREVKASGGLLNYPGDSEVWDLAKSYVSEMVTEDVNQREIARISVCVGPYLQPLMKDDNIANGNLQGFPSQDEVRTCFVEHNQGEDADLSILEYTAKDPKLQAEGIERISKVLEEVGFTAGPEGRQSEKVGSLSGGWKMKLALARAMLLRADVLLLDEPTNHLDVANVKWLEEYLKTHTEITSLIVSHDSGFLDDVCTDVYHYEGKKLVCYKGNLAAFVKQKPEAKSYYTLSDSNVQFKFPPPGILTGVRSNTRSILRMTNCTFTYPGASKPSLFDVTCQLSLSSRVAIIGANGAGKSTLIKLLTGETIPQEGKVEKHPNLRIGYIKQHALEHVEMHMEKTPNQYLQWRYANGDDREVLMKQSRILTEEDKAQMDKLVEVPGGGSRKIEALIGRQKYKKSFQYEVKWIGLLPKYNSMVMRETLLELGFSKLIQEFDDHEAAREGLGFRQLEPKVIAKHFEDVGLDPEIANHNEISGLSGGQKVKVVIAAAMWPNPHLLVLDEPTNFLDRDSLGGLAVAIRDYKGGVVMISHNEEFVGALCPEQWHVADGRVMHKGHLAVSLDRFEDSSRPGSSLASSNVSSAMASAAGSPSGTPGGSAVQSEAEGGDMKFKSKKKKKLTRAQMKEREVRRRLRHIEWLNSPKGTPHPPDSDDE
ncbi:[NU+] prion formation protein 1 [Cryomyces antarcticus]|uniref:[NU+] prion formation protein 1 n=1 Tax=Cryomyces antarcticus TaxID=329879 RepID=A0ABR0LP40_9PEZI|nr:[NU+] prion formation protein 1 [Cryomyces antarcticus]